MDPASYVVWALCLCQLAHAVKVKVVMHSEQDESKPEDEETRTEPWEARKRDVTMLPFIKQTRDRPRGKHDDRAERVDRADRAERTERADRAERDYDEERPSTERPRQLHPNEMIFPLIYRQSHINSMFKFGDNWYTWSTEKRTDGSKATNYYICYDEPKHCDEIGWERTDSLPKCAFQIDSLMSDDRACINPFGVEPHTTGACDGAEQMKVSEMVSACGPRIRSLWRFFRVGRRPPNAAKPADVNSLICEDEEECYISIEYRIHHDRITFSLHEPTRGQTFKSALKREVAEDEGKSAVIRSAGTGTGVVAGAGGSGGGGVATGGGGVGGGGRRAHRDKKPREEEPRAKKFRVKPRAKPAEGKGVAKEHNDSGYGTRRVKNKIKIREDVSEDISE